MPKRPVTAIAQQDQVALLPEQSKLIDSIKRIGAAFESASWLLSMSDDDDFSDRLIRCRDSFLAECMGRIYPQVNDVEASTAAECFQYMKLVLKLDTFYADPIVWIKFIIAYEKLLTTKRTCVWKRIGPMPIEVALLMHEDQKRKLLDMFDQFERMVVTFGKRWFPESLLKNIKYMSEQIRMIGYYYSRPSLIQAFKIAHGQEAAEVLKKSKLMSMNIIESALLKSCYVTPGRSRAYVSMLKELLNE